MSAANFPSPPKNLLPSSQEELQIPMDQKQLKFKKALHRAFDILFYQISQQLSHKRNPDPETLISLWQDKVSEYDATHPDTRKKHPQLYLRFYAGDHIDLLSGPAGDEIDIPLNHHGKPIKFTASTILSKNSNDFRQYLNKQGYLPDGICLLIFRQKQNWTYSIVLTRDNNGPPLSDWD